MLSNSILYTLVFVLAAAPLSATPIGDMVKAMIDSGSKS